MKTGKIINCEIWKNFALACEKWKQWNDPNARLYKREIEKKLPGEENIKILNFKISIFSLKHVLRKPLNESESGNESVGGEMFLFCPLAIWVKDGTRCLQNTEVVVCNTKLYYWTLWTLCITEHYMQYKAVLLKIVKIVYLLTLLAVLLNHRGRGIVWKFSRNLFIEWGWFEKVYRKPVLFMFGLTEKIYSKRLPDRDKDEWHFSRRRNI